ncbi:MAG: energy-coupled thiamine transporter ThiT [Erysipelotrichaceae bacterium]|nr:energy-coupled thiamine transporter ThiT [Erysipelotrichaceae bacterium]
MKNITVKEIVLMAFYLALFFVLDLIANALPFLQMPQGGTVGLGTVALLLASYQLGWKKGLIVSMLSILIQFVSGAMYLLGPVQFLLDYFIAFSVYGIACLFPTWGWFYSGVLAVNLIRFASSTLSGVLFYGVTLWGSVIYQAWYMIPTAIVGLIMVPLLMKALQPAMKRTVKAHA